MRVAGRAAELVEHAEFHRPFSLPQPSWPTDRAGTSLYELRSARTLVADRAVGQRHRQAEAIKLRNQLIAPSSSAPATIGTNREGRAIDRAASAQETLPERAMRRAADCPAKTKKAAPPGWRRGFGRAVDGKTSRAAARRIKEVER
jgi:hypothetical protein